jgi:dihydroorotase
VPSLLIHNARIALPDGTLYEGAVRVRDGKIIEIDRDLSADREEERINAQGHVLLPGAIDPQVHFREPGKEYKEDLATGSQACAKGGITAFLEMPNTVPTTTTLEALEDKLHRASQKSVVHYGFFIGATPDNIPVLQQATRTCGVKIFMGASTGDLLVDKFEDLERIFRDVDKLIAVHAENEARINARKALFAGREEAQVHSELRDNQCALLATQQAVALSQKYQRRLHILHLSTKEEVDFLRHEKRPWITCEVTPQHLFLDTSIYETLGSKAKMNPPIRSLEDRLAMMQGLQEGVVDLIATDHAPHLLSEKEVPYSKAMAGMPGVETALPLMLTSAHRGEVRLQQVVHWMCEAPAQAYRIPNKGRIQIGWDADLVLVDLEYFKPVRREELLSRCGWSPFEGWSLTGWPLVTIVAGQLAWKDGAIQPEVRGQELTFNA